MSDFTAHPAGHERGDSQAQLSALEAAALRRHRSELRGRIARHSLRALLGAAPLALGILPQFRVGAVLLLMLLVPLALIVLNEVGRALTAYRELQGTRRSHGSRNSPDDAGEAP